jgi:hypothetical protein
MALFFGRFPKFKKIISTPFESSLLYVTLLSVPNLAEMSLKILTLQITGKMKDSEKIEASRRALQDDYEAFLRVQHSEELKEFRELDQWIKSGSYDRKKKEVESHVFKGSLEYNQLKEFETLGKNKSIRKYFLVEASSDLTRFGRLEDSELLKEYWQLNDYVKDGQYLAEKNEILSHKFQGSPEQGHLKELASIEKSKLLKAYRKLHQSPELENHEKFRKGDLLKRYTEQKNTPEKDKAARKEFRKLKNDPDIRAYFRFEASKDLKYYREMAGSHLLSRYSELVILTGTEEFRNKVAYLKDAKKLEKSESWKKWLRFRELGAHDDVRFYLRYEKSSLHKNYLDIKDSHQLKRFLELKELCASEEFLKRKAYLEDSRKWEKTPEFARFQHFQSLKKDPGIVMFHKYENSDAFDFLKKWEITFEDDFNGKQLDAGKWTPNNYWADRLLGDNFSHAGDLQAYTGGKNSVVSQGILSLQVRKEKASGKRWVPAQGFIPENFEYTSDTLSTIRNFWQQGGIFEAKIKFNPVREVVQSFHLLGEAVSPQITLMESGPRSRTGLISYKDGEKPGFSGIDLKNLKKGKFHIFRLEWDGTLLTWKINDASVFSSSVGGLNQTVHLNLASLVIKEIEPSKLPVAFEVDWIRCYRKKPRT